MIYFYRRINKSIRKIAIAISVTIGDCFTVPIVNRIVTQGGKNDTFLPTN